MRPPRPALAVPLAALLVAGCGGEDDTLPTGTTPPGPGASGPVTAAPVPSAPPTGPTGASSGPDRLRDCVRATREAARGLRLAGRTEATARDALARRGLTLRVTRRDGEGLVTTRDLRCTRVNVAVEDGRVSRVLQVG